LKYLCQFISNSTFGAIQFFPGEIKLNCASKTVKGEGFKADGIIRATEFALELLILETSGAFDNTDRNKFAFDHVKGSCCMKMMLSALANRFRHASYETFSQVPAFFLHARGK
jgi:hypothetical protein